MKTAQLEAGAVYRLATSYEGDLPAAVLDTRRRWRRRDPHGRPIGHRAAHYLANGTPVPPGYRSPTPDVVGVPVLTLPNAGRGHPAERLAVLLDATRAVIGTAELPDDLDLADLSAAIRAALPDTADRRLITPVIATPQRLRCPWPGVRGRAPRPDDVQYTIRDTVPTTEPSEG